MQPMSRSSVIIVIACTVFLSAVMGPIPQNVSATEQVGDREGFGDHHPSMAAVVSATETEYPDLSLRRDGGNPLWSLSLETFAATRNAPLFSPSRRPPVNVSKPKASEPPSAPAAASGPPAISLVGAISGNAENIAIFLDRTSKDIFRLKPGESYFGWTLTTVKPRQATLRRNNERVTVQFSDPPAK